MTCYGPLKSRICYTQSLLARQEIHSHFTDSQSLDTSTLFQSNVYTALFGDNNHAALSNGPVAQIMVDNIPKNERTLSPAEQQKVDLKLIKAVKEGNLRAVKELIQNKANVNAVGKYKETALMCAINKDHVQIAKILLKAMSHFAINAINNNGVTALMYAVDKGHLDIAKKLLKLMSSHAINAVAEGGGSALMYTLNRGHLELARQLLALMSPKAINFCDYKGISPLKLAESRGYVNIVKKIKETTIIQFANNIIFNFKESVEEASQLPNVLIDIVITYSEISTLEAAIEVMNIHFKVDLKSCDDAYNFYLSKNKQTFCTIL